MNDASTVASPVDPCYYYVLSGDVVRRTDRAAINHRNLSTLTLITSQATDFVTVLGTIPDVAGGRGTTVLTGGGDDFVTIRGTNGYTRVDLGSGKGSVTAGDFNNSLDAIRGTVDLTGAGFDVNLSNAAATTTQYATVNRGTLFGLNSERVERQELVGSSYVTRNTFNVAFTGGGLVRYSAGQGGDTLFVNGTAANVSTELYGDKTARDVFAVGFGSNLNDVFGTVSVFGQRENGDFAYYYDYLNPTPQYYNVNGSSAFGLLLMQRPGTAPVGFYSLAGVSFYTPSVGGSFVDVLGTPAGTQLGLANSAGDRVTLGSNGSKLGGTVDGIEGHVFFGSGNTTVVVDDSGNNKTAREARLSTFDFLGTAYGQIDGLTPGGISFVDLPSANVDVRLGGLNDYFLMSGTPLATRMAVDGGAGNDVLVGTGGNILRGGAGRDLLIAGAKASYLYGDDSGTSVVGDQDILIGGTTTHGTDRAKLDQIMAVWTSGAEYETRVSDLQHGLLGADSVSVNGEVNSLYGIWDRDFFLGTPFDETDQQSDETFGQV